MGTYYAALGGSRILNASRVDQSGADDVDVTDWPLADNFIVAVNINSAGKNTVAAQYKLQWRDETDSPGGAFTDLASTGECKFGATDLVNGAAIAVGGRKCDSQGGDTWQNGEEVEGTALSDSIDLPDEYETEIHFSVSVADADGNHQYTFNLYNSTNDRTTGTLGAQITTLSSDIEVSATLDELALTEYNAGINKEVSFTAGLDELSLTEYNPTINKEISFTTILDELALTEYNPTVNKEVSFTATLDTLALTEYNPTVDVGGAIDVDATLDTLILTEYNVVINKEISFTSGIDELVITEYPAVVKVDISFTAGVDALVITEYNPQVTIAAFGSMPPPVAMHHYRRFY
jgi:hypothetical protein